MVMYTDAQSRDAGVPVASGGSPADEAGAGCAARRRCPRRALRAGGMAFASSSVSRTRHRIGAPAPLRVWAHLRRTDPAGAGRSVQGAPLGDPEDILFPSRDDEHPPGCDRVGAFRGHVGRADGRHFCHPWPAGGGVMARQSRPSTVNLRRHIRHESSWILHLVQQLARRPPTAGGRRARWRSAFQDR